MIRQNDSALVQDLSDILYIYKNTENGGNLEEGIVDLDTLFFKK